MQPCGELHRIAEQLSALRVCAYLVNKDLDVDVRVDLRVQRIEHSDTHDAVDTEASQVRHTCRRRTANECASVCTQEDTHALA